LKAGTGIIAAFQEAARGWDAICPTGYPDQIQQALDLLVDRFSAGNKLWICGNGASAADAVHIAAELVGRFLRDRRPLAAIALGPDQSILTALANDCSYETVFSRRMEAPALSGDVVWGIRRAAIRRTWWRR
jgi:D-sedoheptulose 7-phosphate isomerase